MGHTTYTTVVFMQDSEGIEALDIEDTHGTDALFEHLRQWDYGDNYESPRDTAPWDSRDDTYTYPYGEGGTVYVMSVNRPMGYVGLTIVDELNDDYCKHGGLIDVDGTVSCNECDWCPKCERVHMFRAIGEEG